MDYHLTLLLALVAGTYGGPAGLRTRQSAISTCSQTCTASSKFNYAPGTTYEYKYEVETKTTMLGTSDDHSTIGITAIAVVEVQSKCEFILKVKDVSIFAYDSKQYKDQDADKSFAKTLEQFPMRFSFQDGTIETVCPLEKESAWAVNIKKGILSAFQNSMDSFETSYSGLESDVTGKCETKYEVAHRAWRSLTIKKSKVMSECTHRQGYESAIQTSPFRISSGLKSLPILKSSHDCDQEVNTAGTIISTLCHEVHVFNPFSNSNNGATTETTQKLNFIQDRLGLTNENAERGESEALYFDHTKDDTDPDLKAKAAIMLLKDMCVSTVTDVNLDTPRDFSKLVYTMKRIDYSGLQRVFNQVNRKDFCSKNEERVRKFVVDAMPMIGTTSSVQLMKTLISNDDVTGQQADMWLASLAFIQHPTEEMINQVEQLIGLPSLRTKVLLPLSAMIHSYCQVNPLCEEVKEVQEFIRILESNIKGGCSIDQQNFKSVMMSLRALGNTGHAQMAIPYLYSCISSDNPMDIRVAAVQAFRRMSCAADRNNLMQMFRNTDQDSELRIAAYLAVMKCPTPNYISQIKQTLADEKVNQVGSFVWSHLTNLMESSDPANKYVQQLLNDEVLDGEFDLDKMKFSRNYEASLQVDRLNAGAKVDSNLVWSSKTFVPRSATLNLTFDLFGESMNLFEVGGRVEGLETMLESYFGPRGHYNADDRTSNEIPQDSLKSARLSSNKLDDIHSKSQQNKDDLRGAIYMRTFGNELSYNMFGVNNGINTDKSGSEMFDFLKKLRNNEKQDLSMTKSFMFLDSTYTVPTIGGLPLNLDVNGTATIAVNVGGQMDLKNPGKSIIIEGNFEPSGAVQVDSMMSVDAFVTRGGLKMVSTLHTSTGAKGKIELTNGNVFDMSFDLTKEKSEILDVKTSFFMVYDDIEKPQTLLVTSRVENTACSGDRVQKITGLQFCAEVSSPNNSRPDAPGFPFNGPISLNVALLKQDLPNGYRLEAKTIKTPVQTLLRLKSDTPGSVEDRAIGLDVDVRHKDKTLDVNLVSPWKKLTLTGELLDTAILKGLVGKITVDEDARVYNLDAKIAVARTKTEVTYTPTISLEVPEWKTVKMTGLSKYQKEDHSWDVEGTITGAQDQPITFTTNLMNKPKMLGVKGQLKLEEGEGYVLECFTKKLVQKRKLTKHTFTPRFYLRTPTSELAEAEGSIIYTEGKALNAKILWKKSTKTPITVNVAVNKAENTKNKKVKYNARINIVGPRVTSKLMIMHDNRANKNIFNKLRWDYNFGKGVRDSILISNKVKLNVANVKKNVKITGSMNSAKNNDIDAAWAVNFLQTKVSTSVDANVKYGKDLKSKSTKDRVDLTLVATHKTKAETKQVNYTLNFKMPSKDVDVKLSGGHVQNDKSIAHDFQVRYHPERTVALGFHLHNRSNEFHNYAGEMYLNLPEGRQMSFAGAFGKESENKYMSNLEFEVIKGRKTRIDTMLKIASHNAYEVEIGVKLPEMEPVRVIGGVTKTDKDFSVEASFKRGEKLYRLLTNGRYEEWKVAKFMIDATVPERRVILNLDGSKYGTERHAMLDIQWDADNNTDDRFLTNVTTDFKSWDDFEVATTLKFPTRTIEFNMKHSTESRYITNIELSWSPKEIIEFTIIYRDDIYEGAKRTELSVVFLSPFDGYDELGLAVSLIRDSDQYQTKSSVTWAKKKKVQVSATAKVPFDPNAIDLVGTITTPFKDYKRLNAMLKHRFDDELKTDALVEWGRNRLSLNTAGKLQIKKISRTFTGKLDIRTPFEGLRIFILNADHKDDYKKYETKFTLDVSQYSAQTNLNKYLVEMDVNHASNKIMLNNKGNLHITIPNDDIYTTWEIDYQPGTASFIIDVMPMRGNQFKLAFGETHQLKPNRKFTSHFDLIIPTENLKELIIRFNHEDKAGYCKTIGTITKDKKNMFTTDLFYQHQFKAVQLTQKLSSIYMDDVTFKVTSSYSMMPYRGDVELQWKPNMKITIDSSLLYNEFGRFDTTLKLKTPFPQAQLITLASKRERSGLNWDFSTQLDLGPRQRITVGTIYRFDHVKLVTFNVKTYFPQFPGLTTSFKLNGNTKNFDGDGSFAMAPYVGKITTDFNWAFYEGTSLKGAFNLNTPFPQYPYMKVKVASNKLGVSRVSSAEIEYLPTQIVKIESDYRFTSLETLEGHIKLTCPQTENKQVVAGFTHIGNTEEFKTNAKLTREGWPKAVFTQATFSSKDGVQSTFVMDSHFKGYESTKMNFNHHVKLNDYRTFLEYETNGDKISFDNSFSYTETSLDSQLTLLTPFPNCSRVHLLIKHDGEFPNTQTHTESALNDQMIISDFELSHNPSACMANAKITTPYERYETISAHVKKSGNINDFTASSELKFDQIWHVSANHKFDGKDIISGGRFNCPYLQDEVSLLFNHTGPALDSDNVLEYTIGPQYKAIIEAQMKYDLPEVTASTKTIVMIADETRINELTLHHHQNVEDPMHVDITSKFVVQIRDKIADVDFKYKHAINAEELMTPDFMDIDTEAVVDLPFVDFSHSKLTYKATVNKDSPSTETKKEKFYFETPMLEVMSYDVDQFVDTSKFEYKRKYNYNYGSDVFTGQEYVDKNSYSVKYTTPFEGYKSYSFDLKLDGNVWDRVWQSTDFSGHRGVRDVSKTVLGEIYLNKQYNSILFGNGLNTLGVYATITSAALDSPIDVSLVESYELESTGALLSHKFTLKADYDENKINFEENYTPGDYSYELSSPFEGLKYEKLTATYGYTSVKDFNLESTYASSMLPTTLVTPIKASVMSKFVSIKDMEFKGKFTSRITNMTLFEAELSSLKMDATYKPVMKLTWEDASRTKQVIQAEGSMTWKYPETDEAVNAGVRLDVQSPFDVMKEMSIYYDHKHLVSPMTSKEIVLVQYNNEKYFDFDSEFSALNKFTGVLNFRAPRKMEFSFSGINEGESVNGDLVLNWNKEADDSKVRFQFGLADTGDVNKVMKEFTIRLAQPSRIVSIRNTYEQTDDRIASQGKISWDEEKGKETTYDVEYTRNAVRGGTVYSSDLKVVVPSRTVEMSGSFSDKSAKSKASGTLFWDAGNDRNKQVGVTAIVSSNNKGELTIKLPSIDKEITLTSEMAVNEGNKILSGDTKIMYSKDKKKAILVTYNIQNNGDTNYLVDWSIVHDKTNTHVGMSSTLKVQDDISDAGVVFKYTTNNGDMKTIQMDSKLDMGAREYNLQLSSPEGTSQLRGQMTDVSPYTLTIQATKDNTPKWKSVWVADTVDKTLDASMSYDDLDKLISTKAFFPNATSFQSETNQESSSGTVQEGHMSGNLNNRVLHGHLKWRPELMQEVATFSVDTLKQVTNEVGSMFEDGTKGAGSELVNKYRTISTSLSEELKPLSDSLEEELKLIQQDVKGMRRELKRMYKQNELYMKTIEETYSGAVTKMLASYTEASAKLREMYTKFEESVEELTNKIDTTDLEKYYNDMVDKVNNGIQTGTEVMKEEIDVAFKTVTAKVQELTKLYNEALADMSQQMKEVLIVLVDELALSPYMDNVMETYEKLLKEYPNMETLKSLDIQKILNDVHKLLIDALDQSTFKQKYQTIYKRSKQLLAEHLGEFMDDDDVELLYADINALYEQVAWVYQYMEMDMSLRQLIDKAYTQAREKVMDEFNQLPLGILDLHKSDLMTFDLDNGEIEFDLYLPIPMKNFEELMRFSVDKYMAKLKKMADKYFPRRDVCLWDMYYKLPPVQMSMRRDWVPPFDTYATVSGTQHYTTFDGSHFDLAGQCSYVLVQERQDNNFTVVQKYTSVGRKIQRSSLVVMVSGKTVEMSNTYMVTVNGLPTELPYVSENQDLHINRYGNRIVLDSNYGLDVISDFTSDYHMIGLSGWYHGKVAGLLGTYDNEMSNDMTDPDGDILTNAKKFLNAWEVADSCRSKSNLAVQNTGAPSDECAAMFDLTSSSLRPCFLQVAPEHYQHSCDLDPSALCDLATLYARTCDRIGVTVAIPQSCVKCEAHDSSMYMSNETLRYEASSEGLPLVPSTDVVFVVEERQCNRDVANKLKDIIYQMEQSFLDSGMSKNRYSLIGYAGDKVQSHTMEGLLFNSASKFAMGLENLRFGNLGPVSDPLSAIMYATSLRFRTGVKKTVILVSCSPCEVAKTYSYNDLSQELDQRDITLHILRQNGFVLKSNKSPKSQIYGLDNQGLYSAPKRRGGVNIFADIDIPSDQCADIALKTKGAIFDVSPMLSSKVRDQTAFMTALGQRVGQNSVEPECQMCSCELDQTGYPQSVCRRCGVKELNLKFVPKVMQAAVNYKNIMSEKLQAILY